MTYKQAQKVYGIQGRSTVLAWLRKHGTLDWSTPKVHVMKSPNRNETPAQTIKRLQKQLHDEQAKNAIMSSMIDVFDTQWSWTAKKVFTQIVLEKQRAGQVSLARSCRLFGITQQVIYKRVVERLHRNRMPRVGTRKLHYLLKQEFAKHAIKLSRDALFEVLRAEHLLINPLKNYTKHILVSSTIARGIFSECRIAVTRGREEKEYKNRWNFFAHTNPHSITFLSRNEKS